MQNWVTSSGGCADRNQLTETKKKVSNPIVLNQLVLLLCFMDYTSMKTYFRTLYSVSLDSIKVCSFNATNPKGHTFTYLVRDLSRGRDLWPCRLAVCRARRPRRGPCPASSLVGRQPPLVTMPMMMKTMREMYVNVYRRSGDSMRNRRARFLHVSPRGGERARERERERDRE